MRDLNTIRQELEGKSDEEIRLDVVRGASAEFQAMARQVLEERKEEKEATRFKWLFWTSVVGAGAALVAAAASLITLL